jgi:DNA-binding protein HU-beta
MTTKAELIDTIADKAQMTKASAGLALAAITAVITEHVKNGDRVAIPGLGVFERAHRPARMGRNVFTGAAIEIGERYVPRFKPAKALKDAMPSISSKASKKRAAK